jgi:hypothetical protein
MQRSGPGATFMVWIAAYRTQSTYCSGVIREKERKGKGKGENTEKIRHHDSLVVIVMYRRRKKGRLMFFSTNDSETEHMSY